MDEVSQLKKFEHCPQIQRMRGRYLCDRILQELYMQPFSVDAKAFVCARLGPVEQILDENDDDLSKKRGAANISFTHLRGLVALLRGDYREAVRQFADAIVTGDHNGSRFHLALLHTVGTSTFDAAEYQLNEILRDLGSVYDGNRFKKEVLRSIERIRIARKSGIVFNRNIIYYHLHDNLIPPVTVSSPTDKLARFRRRILQRTFRVFWKETVFTRRLFSRGRRSPALELVAN